MLVLISVEATSNSLKNLQKLGMKTGKKKKKVVSIFLLLKMEAVSPCRPDAKESHRIKV